MTLEERIQRERERLAAQRATGNDGGMSVASDSSSASSGSYSANTTNTGGRNTSVSSNVPAERQRSSRRIFAPGIGYINEGDLATKMSRGDIVYRNGRYSNASKPFAGYTTPQSQATISGKDNVDYQSMYENHSIRQLENARRQYWASGLNDRDEYDYIGQLIDSRRQEYADLLANGQTADANNLLGYSGRQSDAIARNARDAALQQQEYAQALTDSQREDIERRNAETVEKLQRQTAEYNPYFDQLDAYYDAVRRQQALGRAREDTSEANAEMKEYASSLSDRSVIDALSDEDLQRAISTMESNYTSELKGTLEYMRDQLWYRQTLQNIERIDPNLRDEVLKYPEYISNILEWEEDFSNTDPNAPSVQKVENYAAQNAQAVEDRLAQAGFSEKEIDNILYYAQMRYDQLLAEQQRRDAEAAAGSAPILSTYESLVTSPTAIGGLVDATAQRIFRPDRPVNMNTEVSRLAGSTQDLRQGWQATHDYLVDKNGKDWGDFLYSTMMSGLDSLYAQAYGGVLTGGASGKVHSLVSGTLLGGGAGLEAMTDAKSRGASDADAVTTGVVAGIIESLFESLSIGNFKALQETSPETIRAVIGNFGKTMFVNASEEANTELANILADYVINGDASNWQRAYEAYMQQGLTPTEARNKAIADMAGQIGMAGLGGAIMGFGFGAAGTALGSLNVATSREATPARTTAAQNDVVTDALIGNTTGQATEQTAQPTTQTAQQTDAVTDALLGNTQTAQAEQQEAQQAPEQQVQEQIPTGETRQQNETQPARASLYSPTRDGDGGWGNEYATANEAVVDAARTIAPQFYAEYETEGNSSDAQTPAINALIATVEDVRQEQISPAAAAELLETAYTANGVNGLASLYNQNTGNLRRAALDTARTYDSNRGDVATITEGNDTVRAYNRTQAQQEADTESLFDLVEDGTLTAEQARAVNRKLAEGRGQNTAASNEAAVLNENGLVALTAREAGNLSSGVKNKILSTFSDAVSFIRNALTNKSSADRGYLGKIPDAVAQRVLADTGMDVKGYNAVLLSDGVRHSFAEHGNESTEAPRGQRAMTPEMMANVASVISSPDSVSLSPKRNARGLPVLLFEKQLGDYYVTAQAVSDGTHSLQMDTMYAIKKKNSQNTVSDTGNNASPEHNAQSVPSQSSSMNSIPRGAAGVNNDGVGAMNNPYRTEQRVSGFARNTAAAMKLFDGVDRALEGVADEDLQYDVISEQESMGHARERLETDFAGEVAALAEKEAWTGEDLDTAMGILAAARADAKETGDYSEFTRWTNLIREHATEGGQFVQAFAKYSRATPEGVLTEASEILDNTKLNDEKKNETLKTIQDLADRYDAAVNTTGGGIDAKLQSLSDLIKEVSKIRNTGDLDARVMNREVTAALNYCVRNQYTDFLQDVALAQIRSIATDYINPSVGEVLNTVRRSAMLTRATTIFRNLLGNGTFAPIESVSRNISVPLDVLLSKYTKTRSVSGDASYLTNTYWKGALDGLMRSVLQVGLDVDVTGMASKYEMGDTRTAKMVGGPAAQLLSKWEQYMSYLLKSTDEFAKGGARSTVQQGIDRLYEQGKITDDSLRNAGDIEALYRTFQDETVLSSLAIKARNAMNEAKLTKDFGVGDILVPFAQVPANLSSRIVEYSPIGLVNGLRQVAQAMGAAKNGTLTAAQQAQAVQSVGRGINGTGLIAGAMALALKGILKVLNVGSTDDDKDKTAADRQAGMSGTQINISALQRWISGDSAEWQPGDTLMSVGFLEPINGQLATGALLAEDIKETGEVNIGSVLKRTLEGTLQAVLDMPVMQQLRNISDTINYSNADTLGGQALDVAAQMAADLPASFIPGLVSATARATDTMQRDLRSDTLYGEVLNQLMGATPGLRQKLPAKTDGSGQEMPTDPMNALNALLLPGGIVTYNPSKLTQEAQELYERTGSAVAYPDRNAPKRVTWQNESIELTQDERRTYAQTYGQTYTELMSGLSESEAFQNLTDEQRLDVISDLQSISRDAAKRELITGKGEEYSSDWDDERALTPEQLALYLSYKQAWGDLNKDKQDADAAVKEQFMDFADLYDRMTDDQQEALNENIDGLERIMGALDTGMSIDQYYAAKEMHDAISDNSSFDGATAKATEFARWLDAESGFSADQKAYLRDGMKFWTMVPGSTEKYDDLRGSGLPADDANAVIQAVGALEPEGGKETVSNIQRYDAITNLDGLSDPMKFAALSQYATDSAYVKYQEGTRAGATLQQVTAYFRELDRINDNSNVSQAEARRALDSTNMTYDQKAAIWNTYGWKASY